MKWWVICHDQLLDMLHRCSDGEDPDMIVVELFANSEEQKT